jgi:hypothetical protein
MNLYFGKVIALNQWYRWPISARFLCVKCLPDKKFIDNVYLYFRNQRKYGDPHNELFKQSISSIVCFAQPGYSGEYFTNHARL